MNRPEITLQIPTGDLREALTAVYRFAHPKLADLSCIRVRVTDNLTYVSATNGSASALALASTIALSINTGTDDPIAEFDLSIEDVQKILKVFRSNGAAADDDMAAELRIDVDGEHLTLTDCSGMFEGQQLVLPRQPASEHRPSIITALSHLVHRHPASPPENEVLVFGPHLALFLAASKVYDTDLVLEHHMLGEKRDRPGILVRIGQDFIGALTTRWEDDDELEARRGHRRTWRRRIAAPLSVSLESRP